MKKRNYNLATYFLSFIASAIGIILNFFLARTLEASSYGHIQYLVAISTTISQFLIFGLNSFLIREAKNEHHNGQVFNKCFSLFLIIVLFILPLVFYFAKKDASLNNFSIFIVIITSILMGINTIISSYYQGCGKYKITILIENIVPKLALFIVSIIFFLLSKTKFLEDNYLIFYIIVYSIVCLPLVIILFRKFNINFRSNEIKSIAFFFGVTITYSLGNNLTKVLQGGLYKNDIALAIISVSLSIVSLVRVFTSVLDNIVKPLFAKLNRENDLDGLLSLYQFDTRMNSYISIPLYLFFIIHPQNFLFIFGESYTQYPLILTIMAASNAISDITGPNGTMLAMTGKEKFELYNGIAYFAVYIAFVFIFSNDKVYGLCWSLLMAQFFVNIAKYIECWVVFKKAPLNTKSIFSLLIVAFFDAICIMLLKFIKDFYLWFALGVLEGIILVFLNCFVLSFYKKSDFKRLLNIKL